MAMAAAIGGPLFSASIPDFLIGFGVPFLIATAAGRAVTVSMA
ncbi:unnamed protein product [Cylicostephanus goldi]|uniref:Uncharacterized protein n=1 Tax=Cylicostephanus goldi TaxID=71465 RepID=A0A3P6SLU4_CYLGO|nr:unnamed protein product [Cylicostephanus goldi]